MAQQLFRKNWRTFEGKNKDYLFGQVYVLLASKCKIKAVKTNKREVNPYRGMSLNTPSDLRTQKKYCPFIWCVYKYVLYLHHPFDK